MNKKGETDTEQVIGLIIVGVLLITFFNSINSVDLCNKVFLSLASFFGLIWLLFGETFHSPLQYGKLKFSLPLAIILLVIWLVFKLMGICNPISQLIMQLIGLLPK